MRGSHTITQERAEQLFNHIDGVLYWKIKLHRGVVIGKEAGYIDENGYRVIGLEGQRYKRHQIVFLLHRGYIPKEVDHRDKNRLNDRFSNLREVTHQQNCCNKSARKNKTSKYIGVSLSVPKRGRTKWLAQINTNSKGYNLGRFETEEEAAEVYNNKALELFGEFANLNIIIYANTTEK
jgi:hypothetical protein